MSPPSPFRRSASCSLLDQTPLSTRIIPVACSISRASCHRQTVARPHSRKLITCPRSPLLHQRAEAELPSRCCHGPVSHHDGRCWRRYLSRPIRQPEKGSRRQRSVLRSLLRVRRFLDSSRQLRFSRVRTS